MAVVREKVVKEDLELGYGTVQITDPTDPTGAKLTGNKVGLHSFAGACFNVKDSGATGDGVTDDATAIQAAIDLAEAAGGIVYFPEGNYLIGTELTVGAANVQVVGSGRAQSVITLSGGINGITIDDDSHDCSVRHLKIVGEGSVANERFGVKVKAADRVQIGRASCRERV